MFYNLQFCTPTARLRGGRPPAALLPGGRNLNVNKIYIYSHFGPWGEPAASCRAAGTRRPLAGR